MDEQTLTKLLWRVDPMGTGCAVNEGMEDEYESQARDIAERLAEGEEPCAAVTAVFEEWFWEDCFAEGHRKKSLDEIVVEMQRVC